MTDTCKPNKTKYEKKKNHLFITHFIVIFESARQHGPVF